MPEFGEFSISAYSLMNLATPKERKLDIFLAVPSKVFFVNYDKAVKAGCKPNRDQNEKFSCYLHEIGDPIQQPWSDGRNGISRIKVCGDNVSLKIDKILAIPTLGEFLDVRISRIPNAGRGLYVMRKFEKDEIITLYCGHTFGVFHRDLMQSGSNGFSSHCKPLDSKYLYCDGLKIPLKGMPAGQFANHSKASTNATFVSIELNPWNGIKHIALKASRDINAGEEIYIHYGSKFWDEQATDPAEVPEVFDPPAPKKIKSNATRHRIRE